MAPNDFFNGLLGLEALGGSHGGRNLSGQARRGGAVAEDGVATLDVGAHGAAPEFFQKSAKLLHRQDAASADVYSAQESDVGVQGAERGAGPRGVVCRLSGVDAPRRANSERVTRPCRGVRVTLRRTGPDARDGEAATALHTLL